MSDCKHNRFEIIDEIDHEESHIGFSRYSYYVDTHSGVVKDIVDINIVIRCVNCSQVFILNADNVDAIYYVPENTVIENLIKYVQTLVTIPDEERNSAREYVLHLRDCDKCSDEVKSLIVEQNYSSRSAKKDMSVMLFNDLIVHKYLREQCEYLKA